MCEKPLTILGCRTIQKTITFASSNHLIFVVMARPSKGISPREITDRIKAQMGRGKRLKTIFAVQVLGKFSPEELNGLRDSIELEFQRREEQTANDLKRQLEALGYTVSKK
jgi:hypothetical protein